MHPDEPNDPFIERLAGRLREPVELSSEVERVVLARLRAEAARSAAATGALPASAPRFGRHLRPLLAIGLAASLAAVFAAGILIGRWSARVPAPTTAIRSVEFALRTPADSSVTLVGDFNDWNTAATPLHRDGDVWTVTVPLRPGRYRYTFIVDGTGWRRDPTAPPALEDDFGAPTSVITIAQR
jgi:hypothetical protein